MPAYSVKTLAKEWECSTGVIYKMIRQGKIYPFYLGTLIRISEEEKRRVESEQADKSEKPNDSVSDVPVWRMRMLGN